MDAPLDTGADSPAWHRNLVRLKEGVKRRLGNGVPVTPSTSGYLVVPVLGQSNAQGTGIRASGDTEVHPLVHQWATSGRSRGSVVAGNDPLFHLTPSPGVSFAVNFAKGLADDTGQPVLLVPSARGDTSFAPKNGFTWDIDDTTTRVNLYRRAVAEIDSAIAACPGSRVVAILWHQGESDVPKSSAEDYQRRLDTLIVDLRQRYGAETPLVIGQMVPEEIENAHPNYRAINAVHEDTPARHNHVLFVPGPRDSYVAADELGHYNAEGQRELGRRMWAAISQLRHEDPAVTLTIEP